MSSCTCLAARRAFSECVTDGQSLDVQDLVHADLKMILAGGLKRALAEGAAVVFNGVRVQADDQIYSVTIRPIARRPSSARYLVVSFQSREPDERPDVPRRSRSMSITSRSNSSRRSRPSSALPRKACKPRLNSSRQATRSCRHPTRSCSRSNEELQSTNEELQSVNEELYTVNAEYQRKIAELTELTNDMDNLLASTEVGTIFLDGQLRIRKFTPQLAVTFGLVPHDVGRPIETFAHKMHHPELVSDLVI